MSETIPSPHQTSPFIVKGKEKANLNEYYNSHIDLITSALRECGAVLFSNFQVNDINTFDGFVGTALDEFVDYVGAATPRKLLTNKVATSTEYPNVHEISLHNELSYEIKKPDKLLFCCITPPEQGGQTHLANVNEVFNNIDKNIIAEFEKRGGWMLIRNYGGGFGPTIEKGFGTNDIDKIKLDCQKRDIDIELLGTNNIRTKQIRNAVHYQPHTNIPLWINHVSFWHSSSLPRDQYAVLSQLFEPEEFPYATLFGDGTVIPDEYITNIRNAYGQSEFMFDWQKGDVLLLDNYLIAHGRKPYSGERQIVVSMGN